MYGVPENREIFGEKSDHSLSHFDDRSTQKQWAREVRRGLKNNKNALEMMRKQQKQEVQKPLGQCRKIANYDEFEFRRKPLFYAVFQHLNFIRTFLLFGF